MIPKFVRPFLWSYDIKRLDLQKDKKVIITSVLNLGSNKATNWLFGKYSKKEIKEAIKSSYVGEWDQKSINLWKMLFDIKSSEIKTQRLK